MGKRDVLNKTYIFEEGFMHMKEKRIGLFLRIFLCMVLVSGLTACGSEKANNTVNTQPDVKETFQDDDKKETDLNTLESSKEDAGKQETGQGKDTLVVYFSVTGTTKGVAEKIAAATDADMYEIVPAEPYSSAGLDWNDDNSRTTTEMNDKNARPEIGSGDVSLEGYSRVYIGYPVWWGDAPRIMSTFVEKYDFEGKTVIPFCTSGGSGIGKSGDNLKEQAGSGNWLAGDKLDSGISEDELKTWINGLE